MALNRIISDVKEFSETQLAVVHNVLKDLQFEGKNVNIEPLGKAGDNFATEVKIVKVEIDDDTTFNIILKLVPSAASSGLSEIRTCFFSNEIVMYKEVLPMLVNLQKESGTDADDIFEFASIYGASNVPNEEIILIEDLRKHNFVMLDKFEPLSDKTMKIVLKKLAMFHSLSYVLKNKNPELFIEYSKKLIDVSGIFDDNMQGNNEATDRFLEMFENEKYKNILKSLYDEHTTNEIKTLKQSDIGSKFLVISHGDTWTNNFLFQKTEDEPTKCVFIDYQMAKASLPVTDIFYLIFNCTDYKTRAEHYLGWIDYYHSELEKSLSRYNIIDAYPKDQFISDLTRYGKYGLQISIMVLSVILAGSEEAAAIKKALAEAENLDQIAEMEMNIVPAQGSTNKFRERIEGLVDSCLDFGYISK